MGMTETESYQWWLGWLKKQRPKYLSENSMAKALKIPQPTLNRILSGKRSGMKYFRRNMEQGNE